MSGIPEAAAHIERQIGHLTAADEHFTNVEAESSCAVEGGTIARESLGAVRDGIRIYSQSTEEAINTAKETEDALHHAGAVLQDPVGSGRITSATNYLQTANERSQHAAEKRNTAIAAGAIAVKRLQTASAGIVGFLHHTESARTHAANTMTELLAAKELSESTPPIQEGIAEAHQEADSYSLFLHRARTNIIRYIGNSPEASGAEIAASLFARAAKELEEGVALLEESKDKPIDEFRPAAHAALERVDREFMDLLGDLHMALGHHTRFIQEATKSSVSPLIQNALQQSRSLLGKL